MSTHADNDSDQDVDMPPQEPLETAPLLVQEAYKRGWTDIKYYPTPYRSLSPCGCSIARYPAGWYGMKPKVPKSEAWMWICNPDGEFVFLDIQTGIPCHLPN